MYEATFEFYLSPANRWLDGEDYPILEDLLRACLLEQGGAWDKYLSFIEFACKKKFHLSIGMEPFEALYGRRCRTPLCWYESEEGDVIGPNIVQ